MPGITELVATVAIVTQFIKTTINNSNIGFLKKLIIEKAAAVVLAVLVSIGTVAYHAVNTGAAFNLDLGILAVRVAIAATMGYTLIKVARPANP